MKAAARERKRAAFLVVEDRHAEYEVALKEHSD